MPCYLQGGGLSRNAFVGWQRVLCHARIKIDLEPAGTAASVLLANHFVQIIAFDAADFLAVGAAHNQRPIVIPSDVLDVVDVFVSHLYLLLLYGVSRSALQGVLTSRLALGGGPASEIGVSPAFAYWASTTRGLSSLLSGLTVPPACRAPQS
ncbi:hypothetical protein R5031_32365 (plasmid) [Pseudomonas aeruginosa]|nr:hypothetical protein [Pseudomonas aeruginosa]RTB45475.1 hypothetical protein EJ655_06220 [Pseudomonas aeruginosa]RTB60245.1 hypothetical protein EJ640_02105 [Pseudomonas aeruginosa]RTB85280.1 hypothetical protein EJ641_14435 [Pseudomonas aeruginosa]WOU23202.1 hypothetical protein R5031_32365 [Pseudomonas aeruginosa]WOU35750.1 hypothetical protein R5027_32385 [Pseudomonas aeruginosa]